MGRARALFWATVPLLCFGESISSVADVCEACVPPASIGESLLQAKHVRHSAVEAEKIHFFADEAPLPESEQKDFVARRAPHDLETTVPQQLMMTGADRSNQSANKQAVALALEAMAASTLPATSAQAIALSFTPWGQEHSVASAQAVASALETEAPVVATESSWPSLGGLTAAASTFADALVKQAPVVRPTNPSAQPLVALAPSASDEPLVPPSTPEDEWRVLANVSVALAPAGTDEWHILPNASVALRLTPDQHAEIEASEEWIETPINASVALKLAPAASLNVSQGSNDFSELFYHVHVPKTGGSTVAFLLWYDICEPDLDEEVQYGGIEVHGTRTCNRGLTDNQLSCFPDRIEVEHNNFGDNRIRAEGLMAKTGAKNVVYVTTLRRGSDRVISQWLMELKFGKFVPREGVKPHSNESLQIYISGTEHTGAGWIVPYNIPLRNNLQVGQLVAAEWSQYQSTTWIPDTNDVERAKEILMTGDWLIGFTHCMAQFQEKLESRAESVHGYVKHRPVPRQKVQTSKVFLDEETQAMLDEKTAMDNALFDWAWAEAAKGEDPRFAGIC